MMKRSFLPKKCAVWMVVALVVAGGAVVGGERVQLSVDGRTELNVVVAPTAGGRVRDAAEDLADMLGRMTGADFAVEEGDGQTGIAVGSHLDFPESALDFDFDSEQIARRDEYLLRSHSAGVYIIGATALAAQHGVWDLLHRLGYRHYFPTETWEIVPEKPDLDVAIDVSVRPDFYTRMFPRSAPWTDTGLWRRWQSRNRIDSSFTLRTSHAYDRIIMRNPEEFKENPEYYALVDGERRHAGRVDGGGNIKFCISNEGLRELVVEDSTGLIDEENESVSLDPSDGLHWCECGPCAEMGTVTDRVVLLANQVARAINELGYGERYVGIYAYGAHSPPPNVEVHPKVVVSLATSFIREGYTFDELLREWSESAEMIGIREYHDVFTWSRAMPGRARGGDLDYLAENTPYFHEHGARFLNSESSDSWASNGLGYYVSSRLAWDVSEADRVDDIVEDFLENSYGEAREPMRKFHDLMAQRSAVRTNEDLLARMYGLLSEARGLTDDPEVIARLNELILYTRYVELEIKFSDSGSRRDAEALFNHSYRMRDTMMVHIRALYRNLRRRGVEIPSEADPGRLQVGAPGADAPPWKSSEDFTDDEVEGFLTEGVDKYEVMEMDFEPVSYSEDLAPAAEALGLREVPRGHFGLSNSFRGTQELFTWIPQEDGEVNLEVTGGLIRHYRDRGNVRFELFSPREVTLDPVDTDESVPPDGEAYEIALRSPYEGMHRLKWRDGNDRTGLEWAEDQPMTMRSSMDDPASLQNRRRLYFYVPRGAGVVGGYTTSNRGVVRDGDGETIFDFEKVEGGEGYFSIPVPEGQDGRLWELLNAYGRQMLMTVPPYLARSGKELMLPREVIEADGQ